MANLVIDRADLFAVGATVDARPMTAGGLTTGGAAGAITESQVVAANGKATFTTLTDGTAYVLSSGTSRLLVRKASVSSAGTKWSAVVAARRAAIGTS